MGQEEEEGRGEDYEDNDEAHYGSASPHDNLGRCQEKSLLHNRVTFFLRFAIFFLNLLLHPVVVFYESFAWLLAGANRQTSLACKGLGYDDIIISSRARKIFLKVVVFMILFIFWLADIAIGILCIGMRLVWAHKSQRRQL